MKDDDIEWGQGYWDQVRYEQQHWFGYRDWVVQLDRVTNTYVATPKYRIDVARFKEIWSAATGIFSKAARLSRPADASYYEESIIWAIDTFEDQRARYDDKKTGPVGVVGNLDKAINEAVKKRAIELSQELKEALLSDEDEEDYFFNEEELDESDELEFELQKENDEENDDTCQITGPDPNRLYQYKGWNLRLRTPGNSTYWEATPRDTSPAVFAFIVERTSLGSSDGLGTDPPRFLRYINGSSGGKYPMIEQVIDAYEAEKKRIEDEGILLPSADSWVDNLLSDSQEIDLTGLGQGGGGNDQEDNDQEEEESPFDFLARIRAIARDELSNRDRVTVIVEDEKVPRLLEGPKLLT